MTTETDTNTPQREQQPLAGRTHGKPAALAEAAAKPAVATKSRNKPTKPKRRRRPKRRKAARKSHAPERDHHTPEPQKRAAEPTASASPQGNGGAGGQGQQHADEQRTGPDDTAGAAPRGNGDGAAPRAGNGDGRLPVPTEEIDKTAAETAVKLALRILAALVSENVLAGMSALLDELIQEKSHLLDDGDDEEQDEGWINDRHKRERELLDEAITDVLAKYPDINAVNDLPERIVAEIASCKGQERLSEDAKLLKETLEKYPRQPIGAIQLDEKFSRDQFQRMVRSDLKERFKHDTKYQKHLSDEVPGSEPRSYGSRGRASSRGTFAKSDDFVHGGGLDALFTGGWMRVAKDRIDPYAWSHEYSPERKTHHKNWRQVFRITERDGDQSALEIPRQMLAGNGNSAIRLLMRAGIHIIHRDRARKALVRFLRFKPKLEIIRMPHPGWADTSFQIFVRPDEVLVSPRISRNKNVVYVLDSAVRRHGFHVLGTVEGWMNMIATVRGNSNVALALGTFFAAPVLRLANEPGGGFHPHGPNTIGKTLCSALGQSINGWPHETDNNAFGVSWGGTEAGSIAFFRARTDLGAALDEITLSNPKTAQETAYRSASGTEGPRATSTGQARDTEHASVLLFSTGEKSFAEFVGRILQEGACKRLSDVPAEIFPGAGTAFETIPPDRIHSEAKRLFDAMKRHHGRVGRAWQCHLVELGENQIKAQLAEHREAFLALPEVAAIDERAHPSVRAVVNRFALVAAALRMVIGADLLPWTVAETDAGIIACMQRWARQRGNIDTAGELLRALPEIRRAVDGLLDNRFIHIRKGKRGWEPATEADKIRQKTPDAFDGYVKPGRILIRPAVWNRVCNGFDPTEIARHFQRQGVLITDDNSGKLSKSEQVIGGSERFYILSRTPPDTPDTMTPENRTDPP